MKRIFFALLIAGVLAAGTGLTQDLSAAPSGAELWFSLAYTARDEGVDAAIARYNRMSPAEKRAIKMALDALVIKAEAQEGDVGDFAPQAAS